MKAAFFTLGCKVNQFESNEMAVRLKNEGYTVVSSKEDADVYIVNSCTVTAEGSRKSRQAVRRFKKDHPQSVVVLTGCYPQAFPDEAQSLEAADIVLGTRTNDLLVGALHTYSKSGGRVIEIRPHERHDKFSGDAVSDFEGHTRAFIKIQDGCNRRCAYCIIPKSRGFSRSKPADDIREELKKVAAGGYKEVVFVGINLSAYGRDCASDLCEPLRLAQETPGIERIRLGSLEPDHITDEMISQMKTLSKFCPQFHLSLQSGSDGVLRRMNRHYTASEYAALCEKLKAAFPALSLTTDVIVGFPGETDGEFMETVRFCEKIGFMKVHVFPYSAREGTPAATYENQIDNAVKGKRCQILSEQCDKIRRDRLRSEIGNTTEILFETPKNGVQTGYSPNYIPVCVRTDERLTGEIRKVRITGVEADGCIGVLCP